MLLSLFTGGAASGSSVIFSHWVSIAVTLPLTSVSSYFILRKHGIESLVGLGALVGGAASVAELVQIELTRIFCPYALCALIRQRCSFQ